MHNNLFSTYRQGENRVTATFLAVLQRLSLPNIDRILGTLIGDTAFSLVSFENQPRRERSTPDARIGTGPAIWIETKTASNAVRSEQIRRHLESLEDGERLLLLTPDDDQPKNLRNQVIWSNFITLIKAIEEILEDKSEPPSEKEAFLLREFILMIQEDRLIGSNESRVLVVAAREAWPTYKNLNAYICQSNRRFQRSTHLAFYAEGAVQPLVPKIKAVVESVNLTREGIKSLKGEEKDRAEELLTQIEKFYPDNKWTQGKVMFLSEPDDDETVKLKQKIINDQKDKSGKNVAFVMGQRYVTLESLKTASKTSELKQ